jgi:hypothetical protein
MDVPPGQGVTIRCKLIPRKPGPFRGDSMLYVDDGGVRRIPLVVTGQAN